MPDPQLVLILLLQVGAAMLVDVLLGWPQLMGRLPGPDSLLHNINIWLSRRLDRARRSDRNRTMRGLLAFLLLSLLLFPLGSWLDAHVTSSWTGLILTTLLLALLFGQRSTWDTAHALCKKLQESKHDTDQTRYGAARWMIERVNIRFADGLVANIFIYFLSGFTGLLIWRGLVMAVAVGSPNGVRAPVSPYFSGPSLLYNVPGYIFGMVASGLQRIASLFVPASSPLAGFPAMEKIENSLAARRIPLMTLAHTLGYNFKLDIDVNDSNATWIGPADGKARLDSTHVKRALMLGWVSTGLTFTLILLAILVIA